MSALDGEDWRAALDDVDAAIVDGYQSGFPVERRPFRAVAADLGIEERDAVARVRRLLDVGIFRRFGAVLNPPVIGSSTLAALSVPADRFEEVAAVVNGYPQVNHNYRRDHAWNMWFVVTAGARETRDRILEEVADRTGLDVLNLPMLTDYYIDLEFPVVNEDRFARETLRSSEPTASEGGAPPDARAEEPQARERLERTAVSATRIAESAAADLSEFDRRLLLEIQDGFPLTETPYADVAASMSPVVDVDVDVDADADVDAAVEATADDVVAAIDRLLADGCIKRIGCVVNHVVTGFDSNCMVVWDVPDDELDARGEEVGALPYVTLCYHRPRRPEQGWPYNLFTMIHGRDADVVDEKIDELSAEFLPFGHERLYSTETLKQTGARYEALVGTDD